MNTNPKYELYYLHSNRPFQTETEIQETLDSCKFHVQGATKKKFQHSQILAMIQAPENMRCEDVYEPVSAIVKVITEDASLKQINLQCGEDEIIFLRKIQNQFNAKMSKKLDLEELENLLDKVKTIAVFLDLHFSIEANNMLWIVGDRQRINIFQSFIDAMLFNMESDVKIKITSSKGAQELYIRNNSEVSSRTDYDLGLFMVALHICGLRYVYTPGFRMKFNFKDGRVKAEFGDGQLKSMLVNEYNEVSEKFKTVAIKSCLPCDYKVFLKSNIVRFFHPNLGLSFAGDKYIFIIIENEKVAQVKQFIDQYLSLNKPNPIDLSMFEEQQVPSFDQETEMNSDNKTQANQAELNANEFLVIDEPFTGIFIKEDVFKFFNTQKKTICRKAKELNVEVDYDHKHECVDVQSFHHQNILEMLMYLEDLYE